LRKIVSAAKTAMKKKRSNSIPAAFEAARHAVCLAGGSDCIRPANAGPPPSGEK